MAYVLLRERDDLIASVHRAGASTRPPRQERSLSLDEPSMIVLSLACGLL
jgi:hypothetical protein